MVYEDIIKGESVILRSAQEKDAENTFKIRNDADKSRFVNKSSSTVEQQLNFIRNQMTIQGDYLFIIEDLSGEFLGMKGVYNHNPKNATVETGRFISYGSPLQNTEALLLSFDFAFDILNCKQIRMSALEKNTVMRSMQDRFGVTVTHKEFDHNFNDFHVFSVLDKQNFLSKRDDIINLIHRFSKRK